MVEFSGVFDSWAAWLSTQLHAHASQHANFVSEAAEEVTALRSKQQQLTVAQQQYSKECSEESSAAAVLLEALTALQKQTEALPVVIESLNEQRQQTAQRAESGHKRQRTRTHSTSDIRRLAQQFDSRYSTCRGHRCSLTPCCPSLLSSNAELAEVERRCESELSAIQQHIAPLQRALGLSFVPKPSQPPTHPHCRCPHRPCPDCCCY